MTALNADFKQRLSQQLTGLNKDWIPDQVRDDGTRNDSHIRSAVAVIAHMKIRPDGRPRDFTNAKTPPLWSGGVFD